MLQHSALRCARLPHRRQQAQLSVQCLPESSVRVQLQVGRERLITLPSDALLHVPDDTEAVARLESIGGTIYATAPGALHGHPYRRRARGQWAADPNSTWLRRRPQSQMVSCRWQ